MEIKNNLLTFASASDIAKRKTKHNIMKKVKAFRDITDHEAVVFCDDRDVDYTLQPRDRASILIGLKEGYECASEGCGIISAISKRDAIHKVNQIIKTY